MKIAIIGAGPAGMSAAIEAARSHADVLLLDANPSPGRKLAATGSGRCNISNRNAQPEKYHGSDPENIALIFRLFGSQELTTWLEELGIFTTASEDGWIYPVSFSAQNVVDILQARLRMSAVEIQAQTLITDILPVDSHFLLSTADKSNAFSADRVIVASGGPAAPQLGARANMQAVLKKMGHSILPVQPALAPLLTFADKFHKLQGVRVDAGVTLRVENKAIDQTIGNIIFTSWGVNGPGVMDLSHLVSQHASNSMELQIDFLPHHPEWLEQMLKKKENQGLELAILLKSLFPAKLVQFLLAECGMEPGKKAGRISLTDQAKLSQTIHQVTVGVKGVKGFKDCQLSTGGVPLAEIHPETMRSTILPDLSLAGEVLDVFGPCGGYNLQWAFSSGCLAGRHILD
jgi:predicted Rossmann fold flavoprotein